MRAFEARKRPKTYLEKTLKGVAYIVRDKYDKKEYQRKKRRDR